MARREPADLKSAARRHAAKALRTLAEIMESGSSEQARIAAADKLLDRAHGRVRAENEAANGKSFEEMVLDAAGEGDGEMKDE